MGTSLIPRNTLSHTSARLSKESSRGSEEAESQSLVVFLDAGQERGPPLPLLFPNTLVP